MKRFYRKFTTNAVAILSIVFQAVIGRKLYDYLDRKYGPGTVLFMIDDIEYWGGKILRANLIFTIKI